MFLTALITSLKDNIMIFFLYIYIYIFAFALLNAKTCPWAVLITASLSAGSVLPDIAIKTNKN